MAKKGKIEVVKELEYKGIKLGQKVKVGYWADKEEMIIGNRQRRWRFYYEQFGFYS